MATKFTQEQFGFIVQKLAQYCTPLTITQEFAAKWKDTRCEQDDLPHPNKLPPDWKEYFDAERKAYLDAPLAHRDVRVAFLNAEVFKARERNQGFIGLLEAIRTEMSEGAPVDAGAKAVVAITRRIVDPKHPEPTE